jgi:phospholipid/cholesterol/gamma-HCH transport system permease protein
LPHVAAECRTKRSYLANWGDRDEQGVDTQLIDQSELTIEPERPGKGTLILHVRGRLAVETTPQTWRAAFAQLETEKPRSLTLELSGLDYCDGSGAALLLALERWQAAHEGSAHITGANPDIERLLHHYRSVSETAATPRRQRHPLLLEQVGGGAIELYYDIGDLVSFIGESTMAFRRALLRPKLVRWREVLDFAEITGVDALPIIALLGFLIGLIMAFQSAVPLRAYGADLFVANLVGLSILRELGPLLTAVILAGRSGSAFAAEIGTMKVEEELDALVTMGLDPVLFLVVPRTLAAVAMMPLLTIFLEICGLAGGALVMRSFGIPPTSYIHQLMSALQLHDLLGGLVKSVVFGILVAGIGCYRGLGTGSGPSAVGASTTSAVVSGIVLIILADGVFSILYYILGL